MSRVAIAAALVAMSCTGDSSGVLDAERELSHLEGTWQRGDSGCRITIEGPHFVERCPTPEALLYGDKWYTIRFPRLGTIRLFEGGSYHDYGYGRGGGHVFIGPGHKLTRISGR